MSSSSVVLMALIVRLVSQVMATEPSSFTCFDPKPSETITIDKLLKRLGSTFYTDDFTVSASEAQRVFWRLESTMDKDKADVVLKQYSVQQLLDWNTWTVDECTDDGLAKRRQNCNSFCSHKQASYSDPPGSLIKVNREEAFTKHNLGGYCWAVVEDILGRCPFRQLLDQMSRENFDKVWAAFLRTRRPMFSSSSFAVAKTMKKLADYLAKKGPLKSAELWKACSTVIKVYDSPRSYKFSLNEDWSRFLEFCRAFTNGFTQDGHAWGDLKKVETD